MKADIPKMSISNQVIEAHLALPYLGTDGKLRTRPLAVAAAREVSSGARKRIGPEVVVTALALMGSHAHAPVRDVLDLVMEGRIGSLSDFSLRDLHPTSPFGQLIAAAFDTGMEPGDWRLLDHGSEPGLIQELCRIWSDEVLPKFAARYKLSA